MEVIGFVLRRSTRSFYLPESHGVTRLGGLRPLASKPVNPREAETLLILKTRPERVNAALPGLVQ